MVVITANAATTRRGSATDSPVRMCLVTTPPSDRTFGRLCDGRPRDAARCVPVVQVSSRNRQIFEG
jgi:hypothetical protein